MVSCILNDLTFFLCVDWTLTGTITLGQSEPRCNSNERVLPISESFYTGASQSDEV